MDSKNTEADNNEEVNKKPATPSAPAPTSTTAAK